MPTSHSGRPVICITCGDPRGIGPEIVKKALRDKGLKGKATFFIIGKAGDKRNSRRCARASVKFLDEALKLIRLKRIDVLVTAPVSKEEINRAGIRFEGHTEYLAKLCGCKKIAMMFVSDKLKLSLVTRHIPVSKIPSALAINTICDTTELTRKALRDWFGIKSPRIGISGLNPHCGEGGLFGQEEKCIIKPAIKKLQGRFKGIFGPIPADTLLYEVYHKRFDAGVCMYHDQALAAFKMIARDRGVNLTLGLPFIRTSPDHGTGFDIAGKGIADPGSMVEAIRLAIRLAKRRADNYAD